jgi:hypothetical protein
MFREDRPNHCYSEVDVAEHFPELVEPPSIILWMDIYHCKSGARYEMNFIFKSMWVHFKPKTYNQFQFKLGV